MFYSTEEVEEMKDIMLAYLVRELSSTSFCVVKFTDGEEGIPYKTAYTEYLGSSLGIEFFEISYETSLGNDEIGFRLMVAHELVHVMQTLRKDVLDFSLPYAEQPHEIEAYGREQEVVDHYLEIKKK